MDFEEVNNTESKRKRLDVLSVLNYLSFSIHEYFLSLICFRPVLVFISKIPT
jgi:hypothetical protein